MIVPCSPGFYIKLTRLDSFFWATPEVILVFIYNAKFSYQFWGRKHYFSHEMSDSTWSRRNMIICNYIIWNCEFYTLLTKTKNTKILKSKTKHYSLYMNFFLNKYQHSFMKFCVFGIEYLQNVTFYVWILFWY